MLGAESLVLATFFFLNKKVRNYHECLPGYGIDGVTKKKHQIKKIGPILGRGIDGVKRERLRVQGLGL